MVDLSEIKIFHQFMLLGFDIGGTKCAALLGTRSKEGEMTIIDKFILATDKPAYEMIESLFAAAETLLKKNGLSSEDIAGIGISCGGPLDSKAGMILSPPNLPGWDDVPIVRMAKQRFGAKACLQNDANACAVAEWKYGAGRGYQNIVFLTFGTGMGAGLILNGRLYAGASDFAGEVGHIRMADTGPVGFGKAGSFEGFCSGGGIAQLARATAVDLLLKGDKPSFCASMDELPLISAKTVAAAAYAGDPIAIDIYKISASYLGRGIAVLIDLLNPEVIILGGIYCRAQSLIEPAMRAAIEAEALRGAYSACAILPAALGESIGDMAALGLAEMAKNRQ